MSTVEKEIQFSNLIISKQFKCPECWAHKYVLLIFVFIYIYNQIFNFFNIIKEMAIRICSKITSKPT